MFADVVINKHSHIYTNDNTNVSNINKLVMFNDINYFTKNIEHTNHTINNILRQIHNNYEPNVVKQVLNT